MGAGRAGDRGFVEGGVWGWEAWRGQVGGLACACRGLRSAVAQCVSRAGADWELGAFWGEAGKSGQGMHLIACISWRTRRRRMRLVPSPPPPPRFPYLLCEAPGQGDQEQAEGENQKASRAVPQETGCDPIFHRWDPSLRMGAAGLLRAPEGAAAGWSCPPRAWPSTALSSPTALSTALRDPCQRGDSVTS